MLLELRGVSKSFGGLRVLDGVDLAVEAGAVHALIGPNGSGQDDAAELRERDPGA